MSAKISAVYPHVSRNVFENEFQIQIARYLCRYMYDVRVEATKESKHDEEVCSRVKINIRL